MSSKNFYGLTGDVTVDGGILNVGNAQLYANTETSNVGIGTSNPEFELDVRGDANVHNLYATYLHGDGSNIENIVSSQWEGSPGDPIYYASNVGIANTSPVTKTLQVGSNLYVEDEGSNVLHVTGNVYADYFVGDGSQLTGIAASLDQIVDQGNTVSNTIQIVSGQDATSNVGLVTHEGVGISVSNANPTGEYQFGVGSNLLVNVYSSNVLTVDGNVFAQKMTLGTVTVTPAYNLQQIMATGATSDQTLVLSNVTTGLTTTSNVGIANTAPVHTLDVGSNLYVEDTGSNVLTVTGNVSVSNLQVTERLDVGSNVHIENLRVAEVAANLVTYDSATGELMDSAGLFSNKLAVVSEQPPVALTGASTLVEKHGTYTIEASSTATDSEVYHLFDKVSGETNKWVTDGNYSTVGETKGDYNGSANLTGEDNPTGEWVKITMPYKTILRHVKIESTNQSVEDIKLVGLNSDGLTWSVLKTVTGLTGTTHTIIVNATTHHKTYGLIVEKTNTTTGRSAVEIGDLKLFTESFSIDGGKVEMATSMVMGGETTMDQHGPHSRDPKAVPLKKYPEIVFDASKYDQNHSTSTYVQAGYTVTASSQANDVKNAATLYDGKFPDIDTSKTAWQGKINTYDSNGDATSIDTLTGITGGVGSRNGSYTTLELPHKIKVSRLQLHTRNLTNHSSPGHPGQVYVYGSNDGSSWTQIGSHLFTSTPSGPIWQTIDINSTTLYNYFALQATSILGTTGRLSLIDLEWYGYEEDPPAGDTSVDTTFTSIMNTPQTTGAQVYVDGNLGETLTNRVTGPDATGPSATYDETGKYWELNGTLTSNIAVEANTFLEGDAPHSVSVWFNSSNLVSNASNSCIFSLGTEERLDHISAAFSNNYQTVQKLLASDGVAGDVFGAGNNNNSVSMSGDGSVVVVGSKNHNSLSGAVYIFMKDANGQWKEVQKLLASDGAGGDLFGAGVDISSDGNYIAIGAGSAHSTDGNDTGDVGKLYIFKRSVGTNSWSEQQILSSNYESENDNFGLRVSISSDGTYVVTAAQGDDEIHDNAGAGYVFKRTNDTTWNTTPFRLITNDIAQDDNIATSLEISNDGNFIALGVMYDDDVLDRSGSVYMFARTGDNTWVQQDKLTGTPIGIAYFGGQNQGVSLSSDGIYLIVGSYARSSSSGVGSSGAIYFFQRSGSSTTDWAWSLMGDIRTDPTGATGNLFGRAVKMSPDGTTALAHSRDDVSVSTAGAVFVYKRSGSTWTYKYKLQHSDQTAADLFGSALGISTDGSYIVAGSWQDDDLGTDAGAAYIFTRDTTHHLTTDLKLQSNTWHNLTYAYQGEGGSRVTYLDGRKVAEDQAEDTFGDYPPFAMTGYSQGGYVVSASGFNAPNYPPWEAFDDDITDLNNVWHTPGADYSGTDQVYNGSDNFQLSSNTDFGHWIKIEMPHKLIVSHLGLRARIDGYESQAPEDFQICGSNDDVNWDILADINGASPQDDGSSYYVVNSNKGYRYHAIVCSKSVNATVVVIQNLKFYGHRENDLVRLPDPTNVLKYPHIAMTGPAQRGYVVSASSSSGSAYRPWRAFNDIVTSNDVWTTPGGVYNTSTGLYSAGVYSTTVVGHGTAAGEFLQVEFPHKIKPTKFRLSSYPATTGSYRQPRDGVFAGSNNGTDWVLLKSYTNQTSWSSGVYVEITPDTNTTNSYKYLRLIVTNINTNNDGVCSIHSWQTLGTGVDSIPIQIGGGNIDKVANFRVYDRFVGEDQALEIWDAQKDEFERAKSSMTLQKGRLGIGTDEPQGRLAVADEPNIFEPRWPPKPLVGYNTHIEGHGEFVVHRSGDESGGEYRGDSWWIFDDRQNTWNYTYHGERVAGTNDSYFQGSNGEYTGGKSIGGFAGDWNVLESPNPIKINDIIRMRVRSSGQGVGGFIIAAANKFDGVWTKVTEQSNLVWQTGGVGESKTFHFANDTYYKYYAIIITQALSTNGFPTLSNMEFSGIVQQGQSVLHDGQLTLTKSLTVPRIGPALDADDTPRRDRLVVEYNTSTNPTSEGAVRDTSGRGNDGILHSSVSYDANEKSFGSFGGGGLETMATNNLLESNGKHSFSAWIRFDTSGTWYAVYGIGGNVTFSGNNSITVYIGSGVFRLESRGGSYRDYGYTFNHGKWVHMAVVYDGTGGFDNFDIYMDTVKLSQGSSSDAGTAAITLPTENQTVRFGSTAESSPGATSANYLDGAMSSIKFYDTVLTAEEVKTLYDMGRCDEGNHVVNFSKTRVGIGLGDGEVPRGALDVRGDIKVKNIQKNFAINKDGDIGNVDMYLKCSADTFTGGGGMTIETGAGGKYWRMIASDYLSLGRLAFGYSTNNTSWSDSGYLVPASNNQMNFTGQHRTFIKDVPFFQVGDLEGLVVSSDQNKYIKMSGGIEAGSNAITTNESLPVVSLSNVVTDKRCFGVISASEDPEKREEMHGKFGSVFEKEKGDTRVYINSVGEGAIWVVNTNGSLESGDYITTSNVTGYGQKQDDDTLHNYTVAKITMDCDFNPAFQPVQQILRSNVVETYYLGNVHKVKNVPHEFVTTVVGADDEWSNVSVSPSDVTYAEWSNLEANTQNTYTLTYTQTSNVVYDTKYTLTTTANVTESDPWDRVFIDPPDVTYAQYSNLEANTQNTYTLTFTQTTTDEKTPEEWSALESNTQSLYNRVYYQSVEEEVAATWPGAVAHTRVTGVIENVLDEHGQIQWEDHPTETEKAYKIRYLDANGVETDSANVVHIAAFVGCTYHCG
jgi:hypothetical protein